MDLERLSEIMGEFESPDTQESRKSELLTELGDGVGAMIAKNQKMEENFNTIKEQNHQLQLKNAHYANRVASQFMDNEKVQQEKKQEEKKNQTLSDVLGKIK